jgi:hypothetical protein
MVVDGCLHPEPAAGLVDATNEQQKIESYPRDVSVMFWTGVAASN